MRSLRKKQVLLTLSYRGATYVSFSDGELAYEIDVPIEDWEAFGKPNEVSVSVQAGDKWGLGDGNG